MGFIVKERGMRNKPCLLLLHGGGVKGWMWEKHVQELADYRCIIPDLPWSGKGANSHPYSIKESAYLAETIIRTLCPGEKVHVIGISLGAQVAVELMARAPELVKSSIISEALIYPIKGRSMIYLLARLYFPFKHHKVFIKANMRAWDVPHEFYERFQEDTIRLEKEYYLQMIKEHLSYRLPDGLDQVEVPTLILVGKSEPNLLYHCARVLEYVLCNAKAYTVSHCSHNWVMQDPLLFASLVRAWTHHDFLPNEFNVLLKKTY